MSNIVQFFRSLFSKSATAGSDVSFGLIANTGVEAMLQQRQWTLFEATLDALSTEDLTRLLDGLCLTPRYATVLQQYQSSGDSDLRHLTAGVHDTFLAWESRGKAAAKYVTEGQVKGFEHYLAQANQHLSRAFATSRFQAEAYARLIRVLMGMSEPQEAQQAFHDCIELVPDHLLGHMNYFKLAAPRWFGDAEVLAEFADGAPQPELRRLLQANFLVERYSDFGYEEQIGSAKDALHKEYQDRIDQLLPELKSIAAASLLAIYFNNYAACLYHVLGQSEERNLFLRELGSKITYYPWAYFGFETPAAVQKLSPAVR
ncbi:tetratricopeptide repeat protein [Hymenobacter ruber]